MKLKSVFYSDRPRDRLFRKIWKSMVNDTIPGEAGTSNGLSAEDYLFYNIVLGRPWTYGFHPITNETKIRNGQVPMGVFWQALDVLGSMLLVEASFDDPEDYELNIAYSAKALTFFQDYRLALTKEEFQELFHAVNRELMSNRP